MPFLLGFLFSDPSELLMLFSFYATLRAAFKADLLYLASVLTDWHLKVNWGHMCGKDAHFLMTGTILFSA